MKIDTAIVPVSPHTMTLNRAHKVIQRLRELITTERGVLGTSFSGQVSFDEAGSRAEARGVTKAKADIEKVFVVAELMKLMANARDKVSEWNHTYKVNTLMAEDVCLNMQIEFLTAQAALAERGETLEELKLQRDEYLERGRAHAEANKMAGVAFSPLPKASLHVQFCAEDSQKKLASLIAELKSRKVALSDILADANAQKVTLELPTQFQKELLGA